jgi:hypothetical protein
MPRAKLIEQELTRKLLISPEMYWRFNPRSLYSYDISEITTACASMVEHAAMTRNEWRDWMGFSPRKDMDKVIILENYLPAEQIGKQKKVAGNDGKSGGDADPQNAGDEETGGGDNNGE